MRTRCGRFCKASCFFRDFASRGCSPDAPGRAWPAPREEASWAGPGRRTHGHLASLARRPRWTRVPGPRSPATPPGASSSGCGRRPRAQVRPPARPRAPPPRAPTSWLAEGAAAAPGGPGAGTQRPQPWGRRGRRPADAGAAARSAAAVTETPRGAGRGAGKRRGRRRHGPAAAAAALSSVFPAGRGRRDPRSAGDGRPSATCNHGLQDQGESRKDL